MALFIWFWYSHAYGRKVGFVILAAGVGFMLGGFMFKCWI